MKPLGAKSKLVTTVPWSVDAHLNVPDETKAAWEKLLGQGSHAR